MISSLPGDYHTGMRPRSCTPLTVLLLAIIALIAGPVSGVGGLGSFEEESERVEEVSTEELAVVRSDLKRVRRRVWVSEIAPHVDRTVRRRTWVRIPRAPGRFLPPLQC